MPTPSRSPRETYAELLMAYRGRRVLITGGMGFVGSNLAIRLVRWGAQVTLVDSMLPDFGGNLFNILPIKNRVRLNFSDLRDVHALNYLVREQEILFNLAAQVSHAKSMSDPLMDLDINARSQLLLLEACRAHNPKIRIIHASTRHVYGKPRYLPVDEEHPLAPIDVYSISKLAGEQYHALYGRVHNFRVCILRLTTSYGPRQNGVDFVGVFIRRAIAGKPLLVYGEGSQQRDFSYIDDACNALLLAGCREEALGAVYNLGGPSHCSIREFAQRLATLAKVKVKTVPFPPERKAIEIGDFYADDTQFRKVTGWRPRVDLDEGLRETYDYFRAHRKHYLH